MKTFSKLIVPICLLCLLLFSCGKSSDTKNPQENCIKPYESTIKFTQDVPAEIDKNIAMVLGYENMTIEPGNYEVKVCRTNDCKNGGSYFGLMKVNFKGIKINQSGDTTSGGPAGIPWGTPSAGYVWHGVPVPNKVICRDPYSAICRVLPWGYYGLIRTPQILDTNSIGAKATLGSNPAVLKIISEKELQIEYLN